MGNCGANCGLRYHVLDVFVGGLRFHRDFRMRVVPDIQPGFVRKLRGLAQDGDLGEAVVARADLLQSGGRFVHAIAGWNPPGSPPDRAKADR